MMSQPVTRTLALNRILNRFDVPVARRMISARGVSTHFLNAGEGFPLLLVHGAGAGAVQWRPVFRLLASRYSVFASDVVGYGETDKPNGPYDRHCFARWLFDFVEALQLRQFHLVASSQSGPAALEFTAEHPRRVRKLVLVDSAGFGGRPPLGALLGMVWLYSRPSQAALRWQKRYLVHSPESLDDELAAYAVAVAGMPGGKRAFWQGRGRALERMPTSLPRRVGRPTLIVWGKADRLFPASDAKQAKGLLPNAGLRLLTNAGHLSYLDQPEFFGQAIVEFLSEGESSPTPT
jgi:4,5:9,10-diseco-3-hydroxy-5,9,17-trioxoandrosta-1(10),2-diene-4-oate hydrolase